MCIAILSTAHPEYPLILLNNRDVTPPSPSHQLPFANPTNKPQEYLHRPTAPATWWPEPDSQVLGGYDLHRPAHGTWLGITRQGRIAVLTNYREEDQTIVQGALSRGLIPNAWLKTPPESPQSTEDFARHMIEEDGVSAVGGFSLCYGFAKDVVKEGEGLAIVSNRTPDINGLIHILRSKGETIALSNAAYGDRSWPKVVHGESWTASAITQSIAARETRDQLVTRLLAVLSTDTMPRQKENEGWDMYLSQLRHSVFIPAIGREHLEAHGMPRHEVGDVVKQKAVDATSGCYGTGKQSVVLVDREGKVFYLERTLFDSEARPVVKGEGDRVFEFQIEGW